MDCDKALAAVTIVPSPPAGWTAGGVYPGGKDADLAFFDCVTPEFHGQPKLVLVDGKIVFSKM